jgi:glycyl-tRNA synthetase beta chain
MAHFLMEIGVEEMPARFLPGLEEELTTRWTQALAEAMVDFAAVQAASTPRRLVVEMVDVAPCQREAEVEIFGPPAKVAFDAAGNLTKAGEGFARSQGVGMDALYRTATPKGEYVAVRKKVGGRRTQEILAEVASGVLAGLPFPKRMHWVGKEWTFGRPVRWILALLDQEIVPVRFAHLTAGRHTYGHRVAGFGPWEVAHAGQYRQVLAAQGGVVLDAAARRQTIMTQGEAAAVQVHGTVVWNDALLTEVTGLVEAPWVVLGSFDPSFLEIPEEVLLTSMQSHQKSFGVRGADGALLPYFVAVANIRSPKPDVVRKGWERVLRARLEDARFFWRTDLAASWEDWLQRLEQVTFVAGLGSMADKARRVQQMVEAWGLEPDLLHVATRAAMLCKADLVSAMVYEFGELQGIMGGIYARQRGESEAVAQAIAEHYLPAGPETPVPASPAGAILALADKMDTLVGTFGLGMMPSGTADPYALRRQALGVLRILMEHNLRVPLSRLIALAQAAYGDAVPWKLSPAELQERLVEFFGQRLRAHLAALGIGTLTLEAALAVGFDDVPDTCRRVQAFHEASTQPDFETAAITFKRVANIVRKNAADAAPAVDPALMEAAAEEALWQAVQEWLPRFDESCRIGDYGALFPLLAQLRPAVDRFFDAVMVVTDDLPRRANRLALLQCIVRAVDKVMDFTRLQV